MRYNVTRLRRYDAKKENRKTILSRENPLIFSRENPLIFSRENRFILSREIQPSKAFKNLLVPQTLLAITFTTTVGRNRQKIRNSEFKK